MSNLEAEGPNASQIEYWNEVSGPKWVRLGNDIDAQIAPLGREVMDVAEISPGEKILDLPEERGSEKFGLHTRHLNAQMVKACGPSAREAA